MNDFIIFEKIWHWLSVEKNLSTKDVASIVGITKEELLFDPSEMKASTIGKIQEFNRKYYEDYLQRGTNIWDEQNKPDTIIKKKPPPVDKPVENSRDNDHQLKAMERESQEKVLMNKIHELRKICPPHIKLDITIRDI